MIILNKMYTGSYLSSQDNNIGHEIINEYKSDDEKQYIYVNPYQKVRDLPNEENYVIQIGCVNCNCYEVLSCAKIKSECKTKGAELEYGGHSLEELFGANSDNAEYYAHLEVSGFKKCKSKTYLCSLNEYPTNSETYIKLDNFVFGKQNSRRYVYKEKDKKYHDVLVDFINKEDYWDGDNTKLIINNDENQDNKEGINILDVVGKQYEELAFSNWLSFYLKNKNLCKKFIKECLILKEITDADFEYPIDIKREYQHIDILIKSKNFVIVIENKVDSDINGEKTNKNDITETQLNRYSETIEKDFKEIEESKRYFRIFKPNYNKLNKLQFDEKWNIINYKQIYEFFNLLKSSNQLSELDYLDEFVNALQPLTQERKKDYKEIVESRLIRRIKELEEKSIAF